MRLRSRSAAARGACTCTMTIPGQATFTPTAMNTPRLWTFAQALSTIRVVRAVAGPSEENHKNISSRSFSNSQLHLLPRLVVDRAVGPQRRLARVCSGRRQAAAAEPLARAPDTLGDSTGAQL